MTIRPALPEDAAAVVALRLLVYPFLVRGEAATRRLIESAPPEWSALRLVAESDAGTVVGAAFARRNTSTSAPDVGEISLLHVHPGHRGAGHGSALLKAAVEHLRSVGVRRTRAVVLPSALPFAEARGFSPSRGIRYSARQLSDPLPPAPAPDGYSLVPVSSLSAPDLYAAEAAAIGDEPSDVPADGVSFADWSYDVWEDPGLDRTISYAALDAAGAVASFTLVQRDGGRAWSDMTATVPDHRGRGLARAVKTAALSAAAAAGITVAYTSNDSSNAPMLAVNTHLGYRPAATLHSTMANL